MGAGARFSGFCLDYAFVPFSLFSSTHRFSLTFDYSAWAKEARAAIKSAVAAPLNLKVKTSPGRLDASWEAPGAGAAGYYLYLRRGAKAALEKLNAKPASQKIAALRNMQEGVEYGLAVSAVDEKGVEGPLSPEVHARIGGASSSSLAAPSAPKGLKHSLEKGQVALSWDANPEQDVSSYLVYASSRPGTGYALLRGGAVKTNQASFEAKSFSSSYVYFVVKAVRNVDNKTMESDFSQELTVRLK